jgi:hypothetical protein
MKKEPKTTICNTEKPLKNTEKPLKNTEKPLKNTEKPNNITENPFCLNSITCLCVDAMLACRLCLIHIKLTSLFL